MNTGSPRWLQILDKKYLLLSLAYFVFKVVILIEPPSERLFESQMRWCIWAWHHCVLNKWLRWSPSWLISNAPWSSSSLLWCWLESCFRNHVSKCTTLVCSLLGRPSHLSWPMWMEAGRLDTAGASWSVLFRTSEPLLPLCRLFSSTAGLAKASATKAQAQWQWWF